MSNQKNQSLICLVLMSMQIQNLPKGHNSYVHQTRPHAQGADLSQTPRGLVSMAAQLTGTREKKSEQNYACRAGYYDAIVESQPKCLPCIDGCIDCYDGAACRTCGANFFIAAGICQCAPEFYPDTNPDPDVCRHCGNGCLACTGASGCDSCDARNNWAKGPENHCDCRSGYFEKWNDSVTVRCNKCSIGCKMCYNENTCIVWDVPAPELAGSSSRASSESDRQRVLMDQALSIVPTWAQVVQALRDPLQSFAQRDPAFTLFSDPPGTAMEMTGISLYNGNFGSNHAHSMKVTDLNPDAIWAVAMTLTNAWSNGNGPSFLYNNGYQCTKVNGRYTPGYYNKKDQNDNIISYSFKTFGCIGCDPSKTDIPDWNYWGGLGPRCLGPPTFPNSTSKYTYELSVIGTELSPIAPFTIRAVIKVDQNLLLGWIQNSSPAGPTPLAPGQSDHFLIGKLVPSIGGVIGKFFGENTTAQPQNYGTFIIKMYEAAFHALLYEPGVATPSVTAHPTTKIILMRFEDDTLKTLLVTDAEDQTRKACVADQYVKNDGSCHSCTEFDQKCTTCDSTGCSTCASGYYKKTDGSCILDLDCSKMQGCDECNNSAECTKCESGYRLTQPPATTCEPDCLANCKSCSPETPDVCNRCESGFVKMQTQSAQICCPPGSKYFHKVCISSCAIQHCWHCSTDDVCYHCHPFFFIEDNQCKLCTDRFPNCEMCLGPDECQQCEKGFFGEGEGTKCTSCATLKGCTDCDDMGCHRCEAGYTWGGQHNLRCAKIITMADDDCHESCQSCKKLGPLGCKSCKAGKVQKRSSQGVLCCDPTDVGAFGDKCIKSCDVPGCRRCQGEDFCQYCNYGMMPDYYGKCNCDEGKYMENGLCRPCTSIPGCKSCSDKKTCYTCSDNFVPSNGACLCQGKGLKLVGYKCIKVNGQTDLQGGICSQNDFVWRTKEQSKKK